ncbi:hypothetical protein TTHERM_00943000 (macronuclear) [Tetrahymena thermophila SB210]|uniref:Uncharacterized protein n=1 Tax=Tetrahymena thermophila (strain SB210) TaxID=312017 RepID=Q22DI0_TETTS|nr:hypothetical protein TTHERM_00943000 [Tetrahymena thermophila SB210]EAR83378.1 hypothetical protein TTHERM_00943000 [Tetrahymena thermophila SB210]|eukprot:XP_001031041.1 hypothetical protein TTHERM_00943000 [Tetrahymena thermophila SB210]
MNLILQSQTSELKKSISQIYSIHSFINQLTHTSRKNTFIQLASKKQELIDSFTDQL